MDHDIPDHLLSQLSEFVNSKFGLYFPKEKWRDLCRGVKGAALELGFKNKESYIHRLLSSQLTQSQLDSLVGHLTIGETFFFRDKNVFQVLKDHILSTWIKPGCRRDKSIKFWSAGCCTGEEPYSIAILMDQMGPVFKSWEITIQATDINPRFLQKAKKGVYTRWSFRDTPGRIIEKYFKKIGENRFEIIPPIKKMVKYSQLNLAEQDYFTQLNNTQTMDVIFCRNVLIYFDEELRKLVFRRLFQALGKDGWLIVSPSETPFVQQPGLVAVRFPGAILHRKGPPRKEDMDKVEGDCGPGLTAIAVPHRSAKFQPRRTDFEIRRTGEGKPKPIPAKRKTDKESGKKQSKTDQDIYQEALDHYVKGRYDESAEKFTALLSHSRSDDNTFLLEPDAMVLLAKSLANLGRLDEAKRWCEQAIHAEKLNPSNYYLLATIYQEQERLKESMKSLRQALYLDPEFVLAHFALGNLAKTQGMPNESRKHLENARSLLINMDPEAILPHSEEGMTAGRLMEVIVLMI